MESKRAGPTFCLLFLVTGIWPLSLTTLQGKCAVIMIRSGPEEHVIMIRSM